MVQPLMSMAKGLGLKTSNHSPSASETAEGFCMTSLITIWAAAGTPHAVFELKPLDLLEMTGGRAVTVK